VRIPDVASDHFHGLHDFGRDRIEPAPGVEGVIEDDRLDLGARPDQFLDDVGPDEPIAAGDEYAGVLQFIHAWTPKRRLLQSSQYDGAIAQ
jgi:hypothetical protein